MLEEEIDYELYRILTRGITDMEENNEKCFIQDMSMTGDNELTLWTQSGSTYTIKIERN